MTLDLHLQSLRVFISSNLNQLASSPAQPQIQSALATVLSQFTTAAEEMRDSLSPSQLGVIKDMGGEEFFDPAIADKVRTAVEKNAMTPSVARDIAKDLAQRRQTFLDTIEAARDGLEKLNIRESALKPGEADAAFMIPREISRITSTISRGSSKFIGQLLNHYTEAILGEAKSVELEQLSSSIPTVAVMADLVVLSMLGTVINKFLAAWLKIEKIRKVRGSLEEIGMDGTAMDQLDEKITTTVDQVVEESTEIVLKPHKGDAHRRKELENAVRQDTRRLFVQIERGLTVEFRVGEQEKGGDPERQKALANIAELDKTLKFPPPLTEPLLLGTGDGDIIEGEIKLKHSKKTTTHKATEKAATARSGRRAIAVEADDDDDRQRTEECDDESPSTPPCGFCIGEVQQTVDFIARDRSGFFARSTGRGYYFTLLVPYDQSNHNRAVLVDAQRL